MDEQLLTMADLARRWQVHPTTIRNWINEGKLDPIKHLLPTVRFHPDYIRQIEEVTPGKMSFVERRKLKNEIEQLQKENEELKKATRTVYREFAKFMDLGLKEACQ